jgi:hypothetical protein
LTAADSQTIVEVQMKIAMGIPRIPTRQRTACPWQVAVCLFLVGLFFYNPFLSAGRSCGSLVVCHPASHRATVGSSELEQFAQPNSTAALLPNVADVQTLLLQVSVNNVALQSSAEDQVMVAPQTGFSASLWFRPPPVI